MRKDGSPVSVLHDFYLPALMRATSYDRVAGYFRSSSLAAASEGYTSFVGHDGHLRMIVGADLNPADVAVILAGDHAVMEEKLLEELSHEEAFPEEVKNGLTLLAWMLQKKRLEIRVAFRRHRATGEPLPFDDQSDGYVHEKWFIMKDAVGNRLYGSGSLNESKTALTLNAENIDVNLEWEGGREKKKVQKAVQDFEALWDNVVPHMSVMTLPAAVKDKLISYAKGVTVLRELDGSAEVSVEPELENEPLLSERERLLFSMLLDAPKMPNGQYVGMYTAPVEPWPHQEIVIRELIDGYPEAWMLCDEVGLGKTIEAGLAIRSLSLAGLVNRVLIAAPASLTHQWQREMKHKAMLSFARTTGAGGIRHQYLSGDIGKESSDNLYTPEFNIISTGLMSRTERLPQLRGAENFDLALVDEAHYARRQNSREGTVAEPRFGKLYQALEGVLREKTSTLWLATATPMQIHPIEVFDLIALTDRAGHFTNDPTLTLLYFEIVGRFLLRETLSDEEWYLIKETLRTMQKLAPVQWKFICEACVDAQGKRVLDKLVYEDRTPLKGDWKLLTKVFFASSPLSRVMMRHTRSLLRIYKKKGLLKQQLADREIGKLRAIEFNVQERRCYEALDTYIKGLQQQMKNAKSNAAQMMQFYLMFLRLRFASSTYAIKRTLQRRQGRVQQTLSMMAQGILNQEQLSEWQLKIEDAQVDDSDENDISEDFDFSAFLKDRTKADLEWEYHHLQSMLNDLETLEERPSKMKRLLEVFEARRDKQTGRIRQLVLFTRFLDTLNDIRHYLQVQPNLRVGIYSGQSASWFDPEIGGDCTVSHEDVKRHFLAGDIDILLCTDAAAEGLNLQTADLIINYDMGWNPMKIEQRIGRIDRIGQQHAKIEVMNFCYLGSAEEAVYGRLLERLLLANQVVGAQQFSMLPISEEDFRQLENGSMSEEELKEKAEKDIAAYKRNQSHMELQPQQQYEMYSGLSEKFRKQQLPVSLEWIWKIFSESPYLKDKGCIVTTTEEGHSYMRLPWISHRSNAMRLSVDRDFCEKNTSAEFLSYGSNIFQQIVEELLGVSANTLSDVITTPSVGRGWRRISAKVSIGMDRHIECVAYLAMVKTENGTVPRLLQKVSDAWELALDEMQNPSEEMVELHQEALRLQAEGSYAQCRLAETVKKNNESVAREHMEFIRVAARALLGGMTEQTGEEPFYQIAKSIEALIAEKRPLTMISPVEKLRDLKQPMLFDVRVPEAGLKYYMPISPLLATDALDYAKRVADGLHLPHNQVTVRRVLDRMGGREMRRRRP
jgi:hypothetical protein